jgi:hypothetical protein
MNKHSMPINDWVNKYKMMEYQRRKRGRARGIATQAHETRSTTLSRATNRTGAKWPPGSPTPREPVLYGWVGGKQNGAKLVQLLYGWVEGRRRRRTS